MKPKVSLSSRAWLQIISLTISIKIYLLFLSLKARNPLFLAKWIARKTAPRANIPGTTLAATVAPVPVTRNISKKIKSTLRLLSGRIQTERYVFGITCSQISKLAIPSPVVLLGDL